MDTEVDPNKIVRLAYAKYCCRKVARRLRREVCSRLYQDKNREINKSIMVAGTARSGTTWLSDIFASQIPCRIMYEPFHSEQVEAYRRFHYFQYVRPADANPELKAYCQKIFTGNIRHSWIDRQVETVSPRYRLIKEIRANLFLKWIHNHFPDVPIIFIIRHPCAVVLSRMKLGWATDRDIQPFLDQKNLLDDFLTDKLEIIHRAETEEEKHAVIWCVSNLVPLKQNGSSDLNIVFYENLCLQPEREWPKLFTAVKQNYTNSIHKYIQKPSTTAARSSAILTGENPVTQWETTLSSEQIKNILSVVKQFDLNHLYEDSPTPVASL